MAMRNCSKEDMRTRELLPCYPENPVQKPVLMERDTNVQTIIMQKTWWMLLSFLAVGLAAHV